MFQSLRHLRHYLLPAALILSVIVAVWQFLSVVSPASLMQRAEQRFTALDKRLEQQLPALLNAGDSTSFHQQFLHGETDTSGISVFLFDNSRCIQWSDNDADLSSMDLTAIRDKSTIRLPNGVYWSRIFRNGNRSAVGLIWIKHAYAYENRYLQNRFNPWFLLPEQAQSGDGPAFHAPDGSVIDHLDIESLSSRQYPATMTWSMWLVTILLLLGLMLWANERHAYVRILSILVLVTGRYILLHLGWPEAMYSTPLFQPSVYASTWLFPSLGDTLLNALFALAIGGIAATMLPVPSGRFRFILRILLAAGGLLLYVSLVRSLVLDSRISFHVADLSSVDRFTLLALLSLAVWFTAGWLVMRRLVSRAGQSSPYRYYFLVLVSVSALTTVALQVFVNIRESQDRLQLAHRVSQQRDQVAEFLLSSELKKLSVDPDLQPLLSDSLFQEETAATFITNRYLRNYLSRYECESVIRITGLTDPRAKAIKSAGIPMTDSLLFSMPSSAGRVSYAAVLPVVKGEDTIAQVQLVLRSRIFSSQPGFTELFVGGSVKDRSLPENYSYAQYSNGSLVFEYGPYPYPFSTRDFNLDPKLDDQRNESNGFDHLYVSGPNETLVVVSRPVEGWFSWVTLFSWIFTAFGFYIAVLLGGFDLFLRSHRRESLTRRIRLSVFILVISSFIGIGAGTVTYIFSKYESDQRRSIGEQLSGLWVLVGENLDVTRPLSETMGPSLQSELRRLAENTNIDFNVYDETGRLCFSSRQRLFDQGIVSTLMNPEALHEVKTYGRTQYLIPEKVGRLNYIAGYAPFVGPEGAMTGYLELPYFEKQKERNREVSGFLSALLNIYVLLFALAVLVTVLISSRITQPLSVIQDSMARLRFGRKNDPIAYDKEDEIGLLVQEYNRMVQQLAESAELLARSEREGAWREMAQQVAHEIKNPLTPMKLSVQQLQRAWAEHREEREEMTLKMAKTLIQQIDTLSTIATEFSHFAKMPQGQMAAVELGPVLRQAMDLFAVSTNHQFRLDLPEGEIPVLADKDQLNRVFSNLIKNAVQAIPEDRIGLIGISVTEVGGRWRIEVSDNGQGIPPEQFPKIFVPNFTTKSGGTGLGLAMVKNIIEQCGGQVEFRSVYGEGTVFTVCLNRA